MPTACKTQESHSLIFHGKCSSFFIICLVNVILSVITCGIFLPWAIVRCRRYIFENMELRGARFDYHAKGRDIFISWIAITVIMVLLSFIEFALTHSKTIVFVPWIFILTLPFMMVKSLGYHAAMTSLNNVRFGFQCSMLRAWWILIGMPVLVLVLMSIVFIGLMQLLWPSDLEPMVSLIVFLIVLFVIAIFMLNGVVYRNWIMLFANNYKFGIHRFTINIKASRCIIILLISLIIQIPFIAVIVNIMNSLFHDIYNYGLFALLSGAQRTLTLTYLLYFVGILFSSAYAFSALRNYTFNHLALAGSIHFHSSLRFTRVALYLLLITFITMITCGLTYPWLRIRLLRYQIEQTVVIGNLDELDLINDDIPLDTGAFAIISRGTATALPFM